MSQATALGPVTDLKTTSSVQTHTYTDVTVNLSWKAVSGASTYQVLYKQPGAVTWTHGPLVHAPQTTASITGLARGITLEFAVTAQ